MSDEVLCMFCGKPAGEDAILDDHGNIACVECGESEIETQKREGFWPFVQSIGR